MGAKNDWEKVLNLFILLLQMHRNSLPWVPLVPGGFVRKCFVVFIACTNCKRKHCSNTFIQFINSYPKLLSKPHMHLYNHGIVQASIVFLCSTAWDYSICSTSSMETLWTSPRWTLYPSPSSTLTSHTEQATRSSVLPSTDLSWLWTIWNHFLLWKWRIPVEEFLHQLHGGVVLVDQVLPVVVPVLRQLPTHATVYNL